MRGHVLTRFFQLLLWFALIHGAAIAADVPVAASDAQLQRTVEDHLQLSSFKADPVLVSTSTYYGPLALAMRKAFERLSASELQLKMAAPYLAEYPGITVKSAPRIDNATPQNTLRVTQEFVFNQFWNVTRLDQVQHKMVVWSLIQKILPQYQLSLFLFIYDAQCGALPGSSKSGAVLAWKPPRAGRYMLRVVDGNGLSDSRELVIEAVE